MNNFSYFHYRFFFGRQNQQYKNQSCNDRLMIMIINRNKLVKLCLNYENIACLHISHFKMIFSSRYDYYHFENFSRTNFSVNSGQVSKNFIINLFFFRKRYFIFIIHHIKQHYYYHYS